MSNDEQRDSIDEIASDVDELKTLAEELDDAPGVRHHTVDKLKRALDDASDAADDLENDVTDDTE